MADGSLPAGWGFVDGSSLLTPEDLMQLPDMPAGLIPSRKRAAIVRVLIDSPTLLSTLAASDLMRRYNIPRNRASELLSYARRGHVPGLQGQKLGRQEKACG